MWLEKLLHPLIQAEKLKKLSESKSDYAVIEIPLLVENNLENTVDRVLVIHADRDIQLYRAVKRGNQTEDQVLKILDFQASPEERKQVADDWVENNSSEKELISQLNSLHNKYMEMAKK